MAETATYDAPAIRTAEDLLDALNSVKKAEYGPDCYPFTIDQLLDYSEPRRNHLGYIAFRIPKKSGGSRVICAPRRLLKTFQSIAGRLLQGMYEAPAGVMGFVPGRSVVDNAALHTGKNYVLCADLEDFFPGIIRMQVQSALMKPPFDFGGEAARVLSGICCTHLDLAVRGMEIRDMIHYGGKGLTAYDFRPDGFPSLPQGSPASPVLSNAVCMGLDRRLSGLAEKFGVTYSRYADDITFSSGHNVFREGGAFMETFRKIVSGEGFSLNEGKLRLREKGSRQEVTGLVVNSKVNLCRKDIRSIGSLLYIWERYGYGEAYLRFLVHELKGKRPPAVKDLHDGPYEPTDIPDSSCNYSPHMVGTIQGRLAYMKMVRGADDPVWKRLDARFRRLKGQYRSSRPVGTRPAYLHSWRISRFEKVTGAEFRICRSSDGSRPEAFIDWGDFRTDVSPSRYCRTRLEAAAGNPGALEELKGEFHIGLCLSPLPGEPDGPSEDHGMPDALIQTYSGQPVFWKVFRKVPKCPRQLKVPGVKERGARPDPLKEEVDRLKEDLGLSWISVGNAGECDDGIVYPFEKEPF